MLKNKKHVDFKVGKHFKASRLPSLWRPPCACGAAIKVDKIKEK